MRIAIRHFDGSVDQAILLAASQDMLRVALSGADDVLELRWSGGQWVTEDGFPVEIDTAAVDEALDQQLWDSLESALIETAEPMLHWRVADAEYAPMSIN